MNQQATSGAGDLFTFMRKTNEAYAVRHGLPVERQFSDAELVESHKGLSEAERDLLGMQPAERLGELSAIEQAALNDLNATTLIPFRVTVTTNDRLEVVNVLAPDACSANIQIMEMLFGDFDAIKPKAIKIKVEPVKVSELRRAA